MYTTKVVIADAVSVQYNENSQKIENFWSAQVWSAR